MRRLIMLNRYALFRNRLRYTILPVFAVVLFVVVVMALITIPFQLSCERKFIGPTHENLSHILANTCMMFKKLADNNSLSLGKELHPGEGEILKNLRNNQHLKEVTLVKANKASTFSLTQSGNLQKMFIDSASAVKRYGDFKGEEPTAIYLKLVNNSLAIRLINKIEVQALDFAYAELEYLLPNRITVKKVQTDKWIVLESKTPDKADWFNTINGLTVINPIKIYADTLYFVLIAGLFLMVILVLYAWFSTSKLKSELMLCTNLLNGNYDELVSNASGELFDAVSPIFFETRLRINEVTERLAECRDRLDRFYQASADAIVIHLDGIPLFFNPVFAELTGYSEQELALLKPFNLIKVDEELLSEVREGMRPSLEGTLRRSDGKVLYVEVQVKSITYRGQVAESIVIRDITHRKFMERELQMERMRQVKSVIDGQEKERQRLSRELHDGLGQNLVAIKLKLESIPHEVAVEFDATLARVKQMFNHTIDEVRRISNNLMPAALKEFSLAVVLRNLCNEVEGNSGISISLTVGVLPEPLDQLLKTYVYRIVQEALTNVIKHSGASRANVMVYADYNNLHLHIEDNGVGFISNLPADKGNGLYNMKERAILLNGKINIISSPGKGTKIAAEFPLKQTNSIENGQN